MVSNHIGRRSPLAQRTVACCNCDTELALNPIFVNENYKHHYMCTVLALLTQTTSVMMNAKSHFSYRNYDSNKF